MPDEPEKSGQEPNLELPSLLGFGRKKKKDRKTDKVADKPAPDDVTAEEPAPQARTGLAPASNRPKRPPPVPPPPATRPQAEVQPAVAEPEVAAPEPEVTPEPEPQVAQEPEVAPEPEPEVTPEPEVVQEPEVRQETQEDTEVIETVPPPVEVAATEPVNEPVPAAASAASVAMPRSDGPVHEGNVGWREEEPVEEPVHEPVPLGGARRERSPRRTLPVLAPLLAAGITGGIVGLVGVVLTSVASRGCEVIRGVGSCGGIGLLALLVILVIEVLLGTILLRAWRLSDPGSTSFLGVGLAAVFVLLFLLAQLESLWMFLVIPLLSVATFVLSVWITETFVETAGDDLHR